METGKKDMGLCGKAQKPWRVTFDGSFYMQRGRRGVEIPVGKRFSWGEETWYVPAVYRCGKGLAADILAEIPPEKVTAFLEKYRDTEPSGKGLTEEELERISGENPLDVGFSPEIILNGRKLSAAHGHGMAWIPEECRRAVSEAGNEEAGEREYREAPEGTGRQDGTDEGKETDFPEERAVLEYYGQDLSRAWSINRWCFSWATKRPPVFRSLELILKRDPVRIPGIHFTVEKEGDSISFVHPSTGIRHRLTVLEYGEQTLPQEAFPDGNGKKEGAFRGGMEYPGHFTAMTYALEPDIPSEEIRIQDSSRGDRPRRIKTAENGDRFLPEASNSAAAIGIIGGADGPTAVTVVARSRKNLRTACSSLYFDPGRKVEWRIKFYEKRAEDCREKLL